MAFLFPDQKKRTQVSGHEQTGYSNWGFFKLEIMFTIFWNDLFLSDLMGNRASNLTNKYCLYLLCCGGFQGIPIDWPLSDSLRCLPGSVIPGLQGWTSSEWDHHRWSAETSRLCHRCCGQVAPRSRGKRDISSHQAGVWPVPRDPLLPRHGVMKS